MRGVNGLALRDAARGFERSVTAQHQCINSRRWRSDGRENSTTAATASLSPRWLSDARQRIGKCITFGLKPDQTERAGQILSEIARDWRELVAGSEGFLTGPSRRGMHRQEVVWGEMDSMVRSRSGCVE